MDETKIITVLVHHEETLIRLEEKISSLPTKVELFDHLDKMSVILQRLDQERLFMTGWVQRIETEVNKIKDKLQIV